MGDDEIEYEYTEDTPEFTENMRKRREFRERMIQGNWTPAQMIHNAGTPLEAHEAFIALANKHWKFNPKDKSPAHLQILKAMNILRRKMDSRHWEKKMQRQKAQQRKPFKPMRRI